MSNLAQPGRVLFGCACNVQRYDERTIDAIKLVNVQYGHSCFRGDDLAYVRSEYESLNYSLGSVGIHVTAHHPLYSPNFNH